MEDVIFMLAVIVFGGLYVGATIAEMKADIRFRENIVDIVEVSHDLLSLRLDFAKYRWRKTETNAERWEDDGR